MTNKMTENILKSLSSPESFTRGHDLYQSDAVFDTFRQGDLLTGKCKGSMVKSTVNEITTYYIGGYYELKVVGSTETETKYYTGPTGRSAKALLCNAFAEFERSSNSMRAAAILEFSLCENSPLTGVSRSFDHLQSSSVILDEAGWLVSRTDYTAFGEVRAESGTSPTDYQYTGQRSYLDSFGLHYYVARWYDPVTAHFAQADTLIPQPGNSGDWNRYAYVLYNPMRYIDPTGHSPGDLPGVRIHFIDDERVPRSSSSNISPPHTAIEAYANLIRSTFGWKISGSMPVQMLENIYHAGTLIAQGLTNIDSSIDGYDWIKRNLGNAIFTMSDILAPYSFVLGNLVVLSAKSTSSLIIHELGHVLDNKFSGFFAERPSDTLAMHVGVHDSVLRNPARFLNFYQSDNSTMQRLQWSSSYGFVDQLTANNAEFVGDSFSEQYANASSVDYFASVWEYSITNQYVVPPMARAWMENFIRRKK